MDDLPRRVRLAGCTIDFEARCARWPAEERTLTPTEVKLLGYLVSQAGRVISQRELLKEVWGYRGGVVSRTVKTTMGRLRGKVERDPSTPDHLLTVVGAGYRFKAAGPRPEEPTVDGPIVREAAATHRLTRAAGTTWGREDDVSRVLSTLAPGRLVNLTGPAGVGKSRLALEVAWAAVDGDFAEVHRVELASAPSREHVAAATVAVLGIDPDVEEGGVVSAVGKALGRRGRVLLVLDDLDRVGDALDHLPAEWLETASDLSILTTCRRALGVQGERTEAVRPLVGSAAMGLFHEKAGPGILPGHRDPERLGPILQRLDGLPLALEMAAGWAGFLSPEDLLTRLERQLDLLRGDDGAGRHGSLAAAFASSWDLLDDNERDALAQASVFAGVFSIEAAEWVVRPASGAPLQVLRRLCGLSLVQQGEPDGGRTPSLRLLHAVRELASSSGAPLDAEERHARWFARLGTRSAVSALDDQGGADVLARLEAARGDLRLAAEKATALGMPEVAAGCARALLALARFRGPVLAASDIADRVLAMPGLSDDVRGDLLLDRARALFGAGHAAEASRRLDELEAGNHDGAVRAECLRLRAAGAGTRGTADALRSAVAALAEAEAMGGTREIGRAKTTLGIILRAAGRGVEAKEQLDAAIELLRAVGDARTECTALEHLGRHALDRSRPVRARSLFESALSLSRSIGARGVEADLVERLATLAALGGLEGAREQFDRALALRRSLGHRLGEGYTLANLGAYESERRPAAAREPLEKALGIALEVGDRRLEVSARSNLGELYMELGRLDHAARHGTLALTLATDLQQPRLIGFCRGLLAQIAYARGHAEEGRALINQALAELQSAGVRTDHVRLLERAVQCEMDAGRPDLAQAHLDEAHEARELSRVDRPATVVG